MKKLQDIKLTTNEMRTLEKAKILLDKISPTNTYYVEFWKELRFMRLKPTNSSKRGFTFNLATQDYGKQIFAREMWTREEVRQNKKAETEVEYEICEPKDQDYETSVHDYNTGEK